MLRRGLATAANIRMSSQLSVLNKPLEFATPPGVEPQTGYYRNGYCETGKQDYGLHVLAAVVNEDFLKFSANNGNDLREILSPGYTWCLCVSRWKEAFDHRVEYGDSIVPRVLLEATHEKALQYVKLEDLEQFKATDEDKKGTSAFVTGKKEKSEL